MCLKLMMITVRSASSWSGGDDVRTGSSKIFAIQFLVVLISNLEIKKRSKNSVTRKSAILIFSFGLSFTSTVLRLEKQRHPTVATLESQNTFINSKFIKKYVMISIFRTVQVCFQTILNSKVKTENEGLN